MVSHVQNGSQKVEPLEFARMDEHCQEQIGLRAIIDSVNDSDSWKFISNKVELPIEESKEYIFMRTKDRDIKHVSGPVVFKFKR